MLVTMLEFLMWALILWAFSTQVFIPVWNGTKLFPMFRKEADLREALSGAKQETLEKEIEKEIQREKTVGRKK